MEHSLNTKFYQNLFTNLQLKLQAFSKEKKQGNHLKKKESLGVPQMLR